MKIIGLTSHVTGNHDSSAALLINGKISYAIAEERITRKKHDNHFPINAIKESLSFNNLKLKNIDYFASGAPPVKLRKFLLSYIKGFRYTTLKKILQWLIARIALFVNGNESLRRSKKPNSLAEFNIPNEKVIYIPHYLAHAETAYTFSGINRCLIVAWDGYGIDGDGSPLCGSIYRGEDGVLEHLENISVFTSLALYYGAVTVALGFKLNDGEGKTMGLAAYGKKSPALNQLRKVFPYFEKGKWVPRNNWLEINGVSRLEYFRFTPTYRHLRYLVEEHGAEQVAYAAQRILEEEGSKFFRYLARKYSIREFAVAGGIFLNVKFNTRLLQEGIVDGFFVYPNPGDSGIAVGAAIAAAKKLGEQIKAEKLESVALGRQFSKREVKKAFSKFSKKVVVKDLGEKLYKVVAREIIKGKVIGWYTGRDEWGPRALGQRSVLADPRSIEIKERINDKMKQRDWFMPFAPVILSEKSDKVLVHEYGTSFMTLTDNVKPSMAKKILAAIHIDNTARSQLINEEVNPAYWGVINEYYKLTGVPALLNTSFNRHGLPIVHTPLEAIEHLLWGCIDELVIDTYLIKRKRK